MNFEVLMNELANVGLTILCVVVGVLIVNWLDRNVFNKNKWRNDNDLWNKTSDENNHEA